MLLPATQQQPILPCWHRTLRDESSAADCIPMVVERQYFYRTSGTHRLYLRAHRLSAVLHVVHIHHIR